MSEPADGPHLQGASWSAAPFGCAGTNRPSGLSNKEIIRCHKRFVAREVFALLPGPAEIEILDEIAA